MKVSFNAINSHWTYPLSAMDVDRLKVAVSSVTLAKVSRIRFGCNKKTTQEGRVVQRGHQYEIRINFCLRDSTSRLLVMDRHYKRTIERFGGQIAEEAGLITWFLENAKRYAFYLLLHEIAHVAYCEKFNEGRLEGHGSPTEESWCDEFAAHALKQLCGCSV